MLTTHEQAIYDFVENYKTVDFPTINRNFMMWHNLPIILKSLCTKGYLTEYPADVQFDGTGAHILWYKATSRLDLMKATVKDKANNIGVLDCGFVKYVDHMGDDLRTVNAARISFNKHKEVFDEKDAELIDYLMEHHHEAPARHNYMTFHIKAPIFVLRQWMKHKISSDFNEISSRYVNQSDADFYVPDTFRKQAKINKQGSEGAIDLQQEALKCYLDACNNSLAQYNNMIDLGVCREQARCVLPVGMYSEVYWTASLQTIAHFIHLRDDPHAQLEIQEFARAVKSIAMQYFPKTLEAMLKNNP